MIGKSKKGICKECGEEFDRLTRHASCPKCRQARRKAQILKQRELSRQAVEHKASVWKGEYVNRRVRTYHEAMEVKTIWD